MQGDRYDWVMVQVDELGQAVRKLSAALAEGDSGSLAEIAGRADALLEDAFEHSRLALVDARTAALIVRPPARIRAYAQLLAAKARLVHEQGRVADARALARRALELQLEAAALELDPAKIDHAGIEALLELDPPLALGERHRQLLAELEGTD